MLSDNPIIIIKIVACLLFNERESESETNYQNVERDRNWKENLLTTFN